MTILFYATKCIFRFCCWISERVSEIFPDFNLVERASPLGNKKQSVFSHFWIFKGNPEFKPKEHDAQTGTIQFLASMSGWTPLPNYFDEISLRYLQLGHFLSLRIPSQGLLYRAAQRLRGKRFQMQLCFHLLAYWIFY